MKCLVLTVLVFVGVAAQAWAGDPQRPGTLTHEESVAYYCGLLRAAIVPCDEAAYQAARRLAREHFYEVPDEENMDHGVAEEVSCLLEAAGLAPAKIASCPDRALLAQLSRRVNPDLLWLAMTRGVMRGLDDRAAGLLTPPEYQAVSDLRNNVFGGVGLYVDKGARGLEIREVIGGTPAERAGMTVGDVIVEIDGMPTLPMLLTEALTRMRGREGAQITLRIITAGDGRQRTIRLTRASITPTSVSSRKLDGGAGYIRIRAMADGSADEVAEALARLSDATAIILDLRDNGGGYVQASVGVAGHFLPPGEEVVHVESRGKRGERFGTAGTERNSAPLILLVNEHTASAAEILAAALRERGRAVVVGQHTCGKGGVAKLFLYPEPVARTHLWCFLVPIGRWVSPAGHPLNQGVEPDLIVEAGPSDPQLSRAVEMLRGPLIRRR